jgi:hypothetical protein
LQRFGEQIPWMGIAVQNVLRLRAQDFLVDCFL